MKTLTCPVPEETYPEAHFEPSNFMYYSEKINQESNCSSMLDITSSRRWFHNDRDCDETKTEASK